MRRVCVCLYVCVCVWCVCVCLGKSFVSRFITIILLSCVPASVCVCVCRAYKFHVSTKQQRCSASSVTPVYIICTYRSMLEGCHPFMPCDTIVFLWLFNIFSNNNCAKLLLQEVMSFFFTSGKERRHKRKDYGNNRTGGSRINQLC